MDTFQYFTVNLVFFLLTFYFYTSIECSIDNTTLGMRILLCSLQNIFSSINEIVRIFKRGYTILISEKVLAL